MIHPKAEVHETARVAESATVWQFATVCADTEIGPGCVVGSCAWIGKGCRIGKGVRINHGVFIPNGTLIEDFVFIGPCVVFTDDKWPRAGNKAYMAQPPVIRQGASIGANATILPGVEIGAACMVAAGAIVTKNVMLGDLVVGPQAQPRFKTMQGTITEKVA